MVATQQRFTRTGRSCPICDGHKDKKQGHGERCAGYLSGDGEYAFCTREEYAGQLERNENTSPAAFCHKLYGPCKCGITHNPAKPSPASNGHKRQQTGEKRIIAEFDYRDGNGKLVYQAVRYEPKGFSQRRPSGGDWLWSMEGVTRVPYRLPELLKAPLEEIVYICEGEKAVEAARSLGIIATTNVGGAEKWKPEYQYSQYFKGRRVVILPDNDEAGRKHAKQVYQDLVKVAASAKVVQLPDLPEKGDIVEWIAAGGTKAKLEALHKPSLPKTSEFKDLMEKELPAIRWIVAGMIAEGLTILAGKQKLGKSWLLLALGLAVSMGGRFLDSIKVEQCEVLYLALEDNERRLQDRLKLLLPPGGRVPAGFHYATRWPRLDADGLQLLETWLDEHPRVKLVIIDTWGRAKPFSRLKNGYDADIDAASGIQQLAIERNLSVLATCHLRKATAEDALDELNATTGLSATADNILILKRERGQADASLFGTGREIELDQALSFNDGHWKLLGEGAEYRLSLASKAVIDVLVLNGGPMWPRDIAAVLEMRENTIRKRLFDMKARGEVLETDKGYISNVGNGGNRSNASNGGNGGNTQQYKSVTPPSEALPRYPIPETEVTAMNGHHKQAQEGSVTSVTPVTTYSKTGLGKCDICHWNEAESIWKDGKKWCAACKHQELAR